MYVQKHFRQKEANAIMSPGVQLSDLFECFPAEEAQREFYRELEIMRSLCLQILDKKRGNNTSARFAAWIVQTKNPHGRFNGGGGGVKCRPQRR